MRIENGKVVLERRPCCSCSGTQLVAGRRVCSKCHGMRRGPRGGRDKCTACMSYGADRGLVPDFDNKVKCSACTDGTQPETLCDTLPHEAWLALPFKVYRHNRGSTFNEAYLGFGCVFSSVDYGVAAGQDDYSVIASVKGHQWIQATTLAKDDGTMCDHVGIFVGRNGYSVRPCFEKNASDAQSQLVTEPSESTGMLLGSMIAAAGGNGTLAAALGSRAVA